MNVHAVDWDHVRDWLHDNKNAWAIVVIAAALLIPTAWRFLKGIVRVAAIVLILVMLGVAKSWFAHLPPIIHR